MKLIDECNFEKKSKSDFSKIYILWLTKKIHTYLLCHILKKAMYPTHIYVKIICYCFEKSEVQIRNYEYQLLLFEKEDG